MATNGEDAVTATATMESLTKKVVTPVRLNVLILFAIAYGLLAFIYCLLINTGTGQEAFALIENPLLVLIGGTVAVVKDLVD